MSSKPSFENSAPAGLAGLDERLRRGAAAFPYPPQPDLASRWRETRRPALGALARRPFLALLLLLMLAAAGLLASPARARVLDWIRVGAVRIFLLPPTREAEPGAALPVTATPQPAKQAPALPTPLRSVLDLSGETSLERARVEAPFPILLPAYPAGLGDPDRVFLQEFDSSAVVLVWEDEDRPGQVLMSLTEAPSGSPVFEKYAPKSVRETRVSGHPAVWIDGEYLVVMRDGEAGLARLVSQGHTLIWNDGEMTFRLETGASLEEALRIGESLGAAGR